MIINLIAFQIGWFSCILGSAFHHPWLGVLVTLIVLLMNVLSSNAPIHQARFLIATMMIGIFFDSIPMHLGWIEFMQVTYWPDVLPPPWMIALWGLFASTINISLAWLKEKMGLASILGAIAGPLSYWSGARLGAIHIANSNMAMLYLSIGWAIAVPVLFKLASPAQPLISSKD